MLMHLVVVMTVMTDYRAAVSEEHPMRNDATIYLNNMIDKTEDLIRNSMNGQGVKEGIIL